MNFEERYKKLNKNQREAVDTIFGPVLVVAGPGTGKTELLSMRVANILKTTDTSPESILCLTFTESGKTAMRERLTKLIGSTADRICIFTFHGFCGYLKNRYSSHFWKGASFEVAGELSEYSILENIFKQLDHTDPLKSFHSEEGYSFLFDTKSRIKDLKEAGILPTDFLEIVKQIEKEYKLINNKIEPFINERIGKNVTPKYEDLLEFINGNSKLIHTKAELSSSLEAALNTEELSDWKTKYTELVEGQRYLKGTKNIPKMFSLQRIYELYTQNLREERYIDYADIILNTLEELRRNETLTTEIQEAFQFVLVDEFQDTNNSQFEILQHITNHPVHEGKPNIMAVGDDDQAVYRFQGGDSNNLLKFKESFNDVKMIVLEDNYRSHQNILDLSKKIIEHNPDRLTKKVDNLNKDLKSYITEDKKVNNQPKIYNFSTPEGEMNFVAKEIKEKLDNNYPAHEIAIIGKKHKQLASIVPYLHKWNIPYSYEKETNLLENPKIAQILTILRCLNSHHFKLNNIENYLPEILTFPFWKVDKKEILELGLKVRKNRSLWYEEISNSTNPNISRIGKILSDLIIDSGTVPLYNLIDRIILNTGFKDYYFEVADKDGINHEYISFIKDLASIYNLIRTYKKKNILYSKDIETVLQNIAQYGLSIQTEQEGEKEGKISLLTSHKSKGLEFDSVYIVGANKKLWGSKGKSPSLSFILGMPFTRYKEEEADFIRSLFVAVTRGKSDLTITHTENLIHYITEESKEEVGDNMGIMNNEVTLTSLFDIETYSQEEKEILKKYTLDYRISPTHLNNFLDIINCGPKKFLHENLLRFPHPKTEDSLFGTLMHKVLEVAGKHKMNEKKDYKLKDLILIYKSNLEKEILSEIEYKKLLKKGEDLITNYYERIQEFGKGGLEERFELSFSFENIVLGNAKLTGNLDRIQINNKEKEIIVYDFKTGSKTFDDWEVKKELAVKAHKYRNQLLFYKILLDSHPIYKDYKTTVGIIAFLAGKCPELALKYDNSSIDRMKKLIEIVYSKICNLDFPDTSHYGDNIDGILAFEEDLLSGKI